MPVRTITAEIDGQVRKITADIPDDASEQEIMYAVQQYKPPQTSTPSLSQNLQTLRKSVNEMTPIVMEQMGVGTGEFLKGLIADPAKALWNVATRKPETSGDALAFVTAGPLGMVVKDAATGLYEKGKEAIQVGKEKGIGAGLSTAAEVLPGVSAWKAGEPLRAAGQVTAAIGGPKALKQGIKIGESVIPSLKWKSMPTEAAHDAMFRGLKPGNQNVKFRSDLKRAMPELKAAEKELGHPIETIDDLLGTPEAPGAIRIAKKKIWDQLQTMFGTQRNMGTVVDLTPVAQAMERTITKKMLLESPAEAARIRTLAAKYRRKAPIDEAEDILQTTNDELSSYYAKNPAAARVAVGNNPDTALLNAQGEALRTSIYKMLDAPGGGAAARELKQRYGSLMNMEKVAYPRANVAARQQPTSLSEGIGKWSGYADIAKGALLLPTKKFSLEGVASIAQGIAKKQIAKAIKEGQTTNALIKRAFQNYTELPTPVPMPPPPRIAGLLEPASVRMGPIPDTSGPVPGGPIPGRGIPLDWQASRKALPAATSPIGVSGTIVPDVNLRSGPAFTGPMTPRGQMPTRGLLPPPAPGSAPFLRQPTGPGSARVPSYMPTEAASGLPMGVGEMGPRLALPPAAPGATPYVVQPTPPPSVPWRVITYVDAAGNVKRMAVPLESLPPGTP